MLKENERMTLSLYTAFNSKSVRKYKVQLKQFTIQLYKSFFSLICSSRFFSVLVHSMLYYCIEDSHPALPRSHLLCIGGIKEATKGSIWECAGSSPGYKFTIFWPHVLFKSLQCKCLVHVLLLYPTPSIPAFPHSHLLYVSGIIEATKSSILEDAGSSPGHTKYN